MRPHTLVAARLRRERPCARLTVALRPSAAWNSSKTSQGALRLDSAAVKEKLGPSLAKMAEVLCHSASAGLHEASHTCVALRLCAPLVGCHPVPPP